MELIHWVTSHGFDFLGTIAIVASLLFTAVEVRHLEKAQRITNLLTLTKHHREIWSELLARPELARVLEPNPDLKEKPVTASESMLVTFAIPHLQSAFKTSQARMFSAPEKLKQDVQAFFTLPIPKLVWQSMGCLQDRDFSLFVEWALKEDSSALR